MLNLYRPELAWLGTETNQFGTDEFMKWCEVIGTEPYLCLNFGTGTLDEGMYHRYFLKDVNITKIISPCLGGILQWHWRHLPCQSPPKERTRKALQCKSHNQLTHRYLTPEQVKYWALGNETWGPWQVEQMTKETYAHKALQWAKALKLLDPTLILILCGQDGTASWDYYTLKHCLLPAHSALSTSAVPLIDMHSIHLYTCSSSHLPNATAPLAAERAIEITSSLIDLARIENGVPPDQLRPSICFDEWNVWDPIRAEGSKGAEESYTLSDALAVAVWLNVFIRKSRDLGMACIAQTVNVISPLMTSKDGITKQTTWWPLYLFSKFMRGWTVSAHVSCGVYEGETAPMWLRGAVDTPWLDVSASLGEDGFVSLAVVNIHGSKGFETRVEGVGRDVDVFVVTGDGVAVTNMKGSEEVCVKESKWDGQGMFVFARHSLTLLRWKAEVTRVTG